MNGLKPHFLGTEPKMRSGTWWRLLLMMIMLYFTGIIVLYLTRNPLLFPTVVMLGNFMIPVAYVAFFYERQGLISHLKMPTMAGSFFYGGILGVLASAILEPFLIHALTFYNAFLVGLIEEFAKILGVLFIARHRKHTSELYGLVLGAAAGMGFAALESMGYAFAAFLRSGGFLSATVSITLLRGLITPIGHGAWTAILGSMLYRESRTGHFKLTLNLFLSYFGVVILHGLWDGVPLILQRLWIPDMAILISELFVGGIGLFILWRRWVAAKSIQIAKFITNGDVALEE